MYVNIVTTELGVSNSQDVINGLQINIWRRDEAFYRGEGEKRSSGEVRTRDLLRVKQT